MENEKVGLSGQLHDAKKMCENEEREYRSILGKYKTVEHNFDGVKEEVPVITGICSRRRDWPCQLQNWHEVKKFVL